MKLIKDKYFLNDKNIIKKEQFITTYQCYTNQQNQNQFEYFAFQYNKSEIQILEKVLITEIIAQKSLKHKGYLQIVDYQQGANSIYVITPIYKQTLEQILKEKKGLDIETIKMIFKQLLSTYAYHYYVNMCHFNISPQNIIVNGQKYLLKDMGFDHHLKYLTKTPQLQIYDSPQRIYNCPFSAKADVWSLGVILYECLTGYKPIITESLVIYPVELDQTNPFHQLIIQMTQFYECDRISWSEIYQHLFVLNELKLKIKIDDQLYNIVKLQIQKLQNVDLEILFGLNTDDVNINSISFHEYKRTLLKLGVPLDNYVETLFIIQAGTLEENLDQSGLKHWMNQRRLLGLRSNHRQLLPEEKENMNNIKEDIEKLQENLNLLPQVIQFQQSYQGLKLSITARKVIQSLQVSFKQYKTDLQEAFKRYDPQKIGGMQYNEFNKMILVLYPQDIQEEYKKEVFNFANISRTGIIKIKEFKEMILDLDVNKIQ